MPVSECDYAGAGSDNGVQGRASSESMIRQLVSPRLRVCLRPRTANLLPVTFVIPRGAISRRAHGLVVQDQLAGMPRERHGQHSFHLQCTLLTRSSKDCRSRISSPDCCRPCGVCSRLKVHGADFSLAHVSWSLDHETVRWTRGVALDALPGVLGVVRGAVLLEPCPFARAQVGRDHITLDNSR